VYTPFIRVAIAARSGLLSFDGTRLSSAVGPNWIASPEVLVVFGSPCHGDAVCDADGQAVDPRAVSPTRLYISRRINPAPVAEAKPIRVLPLHELQWLGAIPIEGPTAAATFDARQFEAGSYVVAEWGSRYGVAFLAGGLVQAAELESWR
jgi:hypothetical protein